MGETTVELIIGFVAPLGVDLDLVSKTSSDYLLQAAFQIAPIRLTKLLRDTSVCNEPSATALDEYIEQHQRLGNQLRREAGRGDALACGAVYKIDQERKQFEQNAVDRRAYVIRQLKTPDEAALLRRIYGDAFLLLGLYANAESRRDYLSRAIAESRSEVSGHDRYARANELIREDEIQTGSFGQNVRDTFPLADVFLDTTEPGLFRQQLYRFFDLVFASPKVTPTIAEYLMSQARATALRSSDLSRQVGAVIASVDGSVIAVGMNDTPKVGGGLTLAGDSPDRRDISVGRDQSLPYKRAVIRELLERLNAWLTPDRQGKAETMTEQAVALLNGTTLMGIGEFGRMVHAEMAALTDAARRGVAVQDQVIFCTTLPCQNCAKHIMAAGLRAVVYMEPYPKSLFGDLYQDQVAARAMKHFEGGEMERMMEGNRDQLQLCTYIGIAPRRYPLFEMPCRRDAHGNVPSWSAAASQPRWWSTEFTTHYRNREQEGISVIESFLRGV
jgi:cytidine deaminase